MAMNKKTLINLKEELLELEGMMTACKEKADEIRKSYGVTFIRIDPKWTADGKPGIQFYNGIYEVAEAFGLTVRIEKDIVGREKAEFKHRGVEYSQLPVYDGARYRGINKNGLVGGTSDGNVDCD